MLFRVHWLIEPHSPLGSKSCAKPQLAFELNSLCEAIRAYPAAFGLKSFSGGSHSGNRSSTRELMASADQRMGWAYDSLQQSGVGVQFFLMVA
jgi:hypothetical protein